MSTDFSFIDSTSRILAIVLIVFLTSLFVTFVFNWGVADVLQIRVRASEEKKS